MTSPRQAEENLRMIRTLLERTTLYRTVSVPAAAWGGFLSVAAWGIERLFLTSQFPHPTHFFALWLSVLVLTGAGNVFFLAREARQTAAPVFSEGFWTAGRCLLPSFFCAGFFTLAFILSISTAGHGAPFIAAANVFVWIFFYGLGLLATQHFAPRSVAILGWLFLLTPLVFGTLMGVFEPLSDSSVGVYLMERPSALMALTFGGYHLGYALVVWLMERRNWPGKEAADGL